MPVQSVASNGPGEKTFTKPKNQFSRAGWWKIPVVLIVAAAIGGGFWYFYPTRAVEAHQAASSNESKGASGAIPVQVVRPKHGGLQRVSNMNGSVHPYEVADLYANVSGYLKSEEIVINGKKVMVDIGVHVNKGDILAIIDVPEVLAARDQATADVEQAEAQAKQAVAAVLTARADLEATQAGVTEAEANVGRYTASKNEAYKSFTRYSRLRGMSAVEQDVVDQREDAYESAVAAEKASHAAVITAKAKMAAAKAKIDQALADQKATEANIAVMKAKLKKAEAVVGYMSIVSPYTGVVTHRSYFAGDFIRSASDGNTKPLFTVARTDLMRVVTKISDVDVPYVDVGDPAIVTIQALPGLKLPGKVSRFTESEIPNERTMVTEIDIPNDEKSPAHGRLRDGMYGEALIILNPPSDHLTLPSSCLIGPAKENDNRVLVLHDGNAKAVNVKTGTDDGIHVEILSGLTVKDQVIIPDGEVADGTSVSPVEVSPSKESKPTH